jgi:IMP dehydrogenase
LYHFDQIIGRIDMKSWEEHNGHGMQTKFPLALSYDDVLLVPQYSDIKSRTEVDLETTLAPGFTIQIPLISTKMDTVTGLEMAQVFGKYGSFGILPRFDTPEVQAKKIAEIAKTGCLTAAAVGVKDGYRERAEMLVKAGATILNIDVAHGHMQSALDATTDLKNLFGKRVLIISGIVATRESAMDLYKAGADTLLVGIGAGAICTTRIQTGCGVPGFASLLEVAPIAKKYKRTFMPDAGIKNSGDIVKALAAGASGIVAGSLFAGTDEAPGDIIEENGKKYKSFNGSASQEEKIKQVKKDGSDKNQNYIVQVEGVSAKVPYKGPVSDVIESLLAGIRSGFSYNGARTLHELHTNAKFIQITPGGVRESNAHDVIVTS